MKMTNLSMMVFGLTMFLSVVDAPAAGPLRVHPDNPRYFTDDTERAIYQPPDGAIVLHLPAATWLVEWFDPGQGTIMPQEELELEAGKHQFRAPFPGPAALHLRAKR